MNLKNIDTVFSPPHLAAVLQRLKLSGATPLKVAFSGGLDSTVLLHALVCLRESLGLSLTAIHVDHGLHKDSAAWSRHAVEFCRRLEVPCVLEQVTVSQVRELGLEAAARRARSTALARHIHQDDVLLTAHQADDQAETLLLQLLRGAGLHGMAAMPVITSFHRGRMARPLLEFSRMHLSAYAEEQSLVWIHDSSNDDHKLSRNYLRHQIFPRLEAHWPGAARRIAYSAGVAADAIVLLDELAESDWKLVRGVENTTLSVTALRRLSLPRRRNLIRFWLRRQDFLPPTATHLDQVLKHVELDPRSRRAVTRWPGIEVWRYRDELVALKPGLPMDSSWRNCWNFTDPLAIPGLGILRAEVAHGEGLSRDRIGRFPVEVSLRQGGETCRLPGRLHHHKLKKLLQEAHVPPWERNRLPLVYVDGELAAIGDRWVCEPFVARGGELAWKLSLDPVVDTP